VKRRRGVNRSGWWVGGSWWVVGQECVGWWWCKYAVHPFTPTYLPFFPYSTVLPLLSSSPSSLLFLLFSPLSSLLFYSTR